MHKLSRFYLANVGYKLAWYEGVLLDFNDADTGEPTHTIVNLVNQGGKTTMLSLFFSNFDTSRSRFLHFLSQKRRFEEYFDASGVPGILAVEWHVPSYDLVDTPEKLVTGQFVVRRNKDDNEPERYFFYYRCGDGLELKSIPGDNLGHAKPLRSLEQVRGWLSQMRVRHPGRFDSTQNHSEWERMLLNQGLDVEMLRHQVDFNRHEGSMDDAFLDFKTEHEFVRRFLTLSMKTDVADGVRESIAAHCQRLARKRPYELQREQLQRLEITFGEFACGAKDDAIAQAALARADEDIAVACATLDAHVRHHQETAERERAAASVQDSVEAEQRKQRELHLRRASSIRRLQLERDLAAAKKNLETARKDAAEARQEEREYRAAQRLERYEQILAEVASLEAAIAAADGEVRPYREAAERATATLAAGLTVEADKHDDAAALSKRAEDALRQKLTEIEKDLERLNQQQREAAGRQGRLETRLADARRQQRQLLEDGALGADETVASALARLRLAVTAAKRAAEEARDRALQLEAHERDSREERGRHQIEQAQHQGLASQLERQVAETEAQRESLRHNPILTRAADAEIVEPEADGVRLALSGFIESSRQRLSVAELDLARRQEAVHSIDQTRLAGHDPDVARIVQALTNASIPGARSYAGYLADVFKDPEKARKIVLSNPGRYLGVAVAHTRALEQAAAVMGAHSLALTRPVVISVYSDREDSARAGEQFVVGPDNDALYSFSAAEAARPHLVELRDDAETASRTLRAEYDKALQVRDQLDRYLKDVGTGGIAYLRAQHRAEVSAAADAGQAAATAARAADRAREERGQVLDVALRREDEARAHTGHIDRLTRFERDCGTSLPTWEADLAQVNVELEEIEDRRETVRAGRIATDDERQEHQRLKVERQEQAKVVREDIARLGPTLVTSGLLESLRAAPRSLEVLRSDLATARSVLEAVERQARGDLVARRDAKREQATLARREYRSDAEGLLEATVRKRIGADYARALCECTELQQRARADELAANERHGQVSEALKLFNDGVKKDKLLAELPLPEPHILEMSPSQLASYLVQTDDLEAKARIASSVARDLAQAARQAHNAAKHKADLYQSQATALSGSLSGPPSTAADMTRFTDTEQLGAECRKLTKAREEASKTAQSARDRVLVLHSRVGDLARSKEFAEVEQDLAERLLRNELADALRDHERVGGAIADRLAAVQSELATMNQDFDRAVERLLGLVQDGLRILKRATEGIRLPDQVPIVAGKTVLTMQKSVTTLSNEQRRATLRLYMDSLAADGNIPETGAALAAAAILRMAPHGLKLKILKMVDSVDEQYVPVDGLSHSGAERISMALLLYFVNAKLRYEERADTRRSEGGVLLLDNPFAKATARPIWEMVIGLANTTGVQLVIATGITEEGTLSVFKRFLRLAKRERDSTGREYVRDVNYQFRPEALA
ncbi:MAG: hypothetical protein NDI84_03035 [Steroidobacteraceae bacterium]|nr:hypothetical protein [Steroidobacteraceae bacterium]